MPAERLRLEGKGTQWSVSNQEKCHDEIEHSEPEREDLSLQRGRALHLRFGLRLQAVRVRQEVRQVARGRRVPGGRANQRVPFAARIGSK